MKILSGVDLVYLPKFKKALKFGGENFLRRIFVESELKNDEVEHLAGIFAAKEAAMKALDLTKDSWHLIQIINIPNGQPKVQIQLPASHITHQSLSISHDGNYVIAQFVALID